MYFDSLSKLGAVVEQSADKNHEKMIQMLDRYDGYIREMNNGQR